MSICEAGECTERAKFIFYDYKEQAGYPISLCKEHLDVMLQECYDEIIYSMEKEQ